MANIYAIHVHILLCIKCSCLLKYNVNKTLPEQLGCLSSGLPSLFLALSASSVSPSNRINFDTLQEVKTKQLSGLFCTLRSGETTSSCSHGIRFILSITSIMFVFLFLWPMLTSYARILPLYDTMGGGNCAKPRGNPRPPQRLLQTFQKTA